jgi:hypothetical protein
MPPWLATKHPTFEHLKTTAIKILKKLFHAGLALASRGFNQELIRRDARRNGDSLQFTPEEAVIAEAIAKIIVPSGEGAPGIDQVSLPDEKAISLLGKIVAQSPDKQPFYSRGLLAFDRWALQEYGSSFAGLSTELQTALFREAQEKYDRWEVETSSLAKIQRGFRAIVYAGNGRAHAAKLYPIIRDDCLQIFYTNRISWAWLNYDGPPMDKGYPSLTQPR